jgi:hypothetical protein
MSSSACDSRAPSAKVACGAVAGQVPRKHRYTAVTETDDVYDVLNTRTSEKNGLAADPAGSDATAGIVNVSAMRERGKRTKGPQTELTRRIVIVGRPAGGRRLQILGDRQLRETSLLKEVPEKPVS